MVMLCFATTGPSRAGLRSWVARVHHCSCAGYRAARRSPGENALVPAEHPADDDPAVRRDLVLSEVLAVLARAHLDDRQRALELPVDFDVALHEDRVRQKRDAV